MKANDRTVLRAILKGILIGTDRCPDGTPHLACASCLAERVTDFIDTADWIEVRRG